MSERDRAPEEPGGAEPVMHSEDADPAKTDGGGDASEEGPVRRPLIRATLELPEGAPATPREPPVFTSHQQARGTGGRQPNRNGRFMRDGGPNSTPNKGKKRSNRGNSQRARGDSGSSQPSGNRNRSSSHPDRQGQPRTDSGNRSPSSRRDRGRKR